MICVLFNVVVVLNFLININIFFYIFIRKEFKSGEWLNIYGFVVY